MNNLGPYYLFFWIVFSGFWVLLGYGAFKFFKPLNLQPIKKFTEFRKKAKDLFDQAFHRKPIRLKRKL